MSKPAVELPADLMTLPLRIPLPVVVAICGYSRATLTRRIREGKMPRHVDRGGQGYIWLRDDVLRALGLLKSKVDGSLDEIDPWDFDDDAFDAALARQKAATKFARQEAKRGAIKVADPKPKPKAVPAPKFVPTEAKHLGRYVVMKERVGGRHAIYFQVPARLRPKGWRPTINLPIDEPRTGDMRNKAEVARIRADAIALYISMTRERGAQSRQQAEAAAGKPEKPDA